MTDLTEKLQFELDKLNSTVRLLTSQDTTSKTNFDSSVFATTSDRTIDVGSFAENEMKYLQIEDKGIVAGQITTADLGKIASIIDSWLSKNSQIKAIKESFNDFCISETYSDLLTLSINELLEKRWTDEYEKIKNRQTLFDPTLFLALKQKVFRLYPFFSHDNLWFSNIIELPNDKFKTPIIFCNKDTFEIGLTLDNSSTNKSFKTKNIEEAVNMTLELLPINYCDTINPIKN